MPSAVVDGEGARWHGDTGTRERRVDLEGLGLVGFFILLGCGATWTSRTISASMLSAAYNDDSLAVWAVLEMDGHAASLVVTRTNGHMHPTEDLLAVMNSDIVLTILLGLCARDMGTEATQVYVLLEKGIARDALMPALAHTLRRKVESLKYLADRLSIPVDAILRLLDGLTREDNMPAFLRVIHKLTDDLPNGNRRLLGLRLF